MGYAQRSKLALKDLGEPKIIITQPDTVRRLEMGAIIGKATGLVERTDDKSGEVRTGLKGMFRTIPAHIENVPDREPCESTVLWLPDFAHEPVEHLLRRNMESESPDKNFAVNIGFTVVVMRASNPQGYSWEIQPVAPQGHNPLDELENEYKKMRLENTKKKAIAGKPADSNKSAA